MIRTVLFGVTQCSSSGRYPKFWRNYRLFFLCGREQL